MGRASAQLLHGATAPTFTLQAALGGDVETVDLKAALAKGPVVLYFFPKSFTQGCTVEAHLFSDHIAEYRKLGATVIGVSGDEIETQKKFSTQECRAAFLVASDPGLKIAKQYDAQLTDAYANRSLLLHEPRPGKARREHPRRSTRAVQTLAGLPRRRRQPEPTVVTLSAFIGQSSRRSANFGR